MIQGKVWAVDEIPRLLNKQVAELEIVWHNQMEDSNFPPVEFTKENFVEKIALPTFGAINNYDSKLTNFPKDGELLVKWYQCEKRSLNNMCTKWQNFGGSASNWNTKLLNKASLIEGLQAWTNKKKSTFTTHKNFNNEVLGTKFKKIELADSYVLDEQ